MPSSRSARRTSLRAHLEPRLKLWLNWNGAFLMGPRYLRFLEAVDETGTIRAAGPAGAARDSPRRRDGSCDSSRTGARRQFARATLHFGRFFADRHGVAYRRAAR